MQEQRGRMWLLLPVILGALWLIEGVVAFRFYDSFRQVPAYFGVLMALFTFVLGGGVEAAILRRATVDVTVSRWANAAGGGILLGAVGGIVGVALLGYVLRSVSPVAIPRPIATAVGIVAFGAILGMIQAAIQRSALRNPPPGWVEINGVAYGVMFLAMFGLVSLRDAADRSLLLVFCFASFGIPGVVRGFLLQRGERPPDVGATPEVPSASGPVQ